MAKHVKPKKDQENLAPMQPLEDDDADIKNFERIPILHLDAFLTVITGEDVLTCEASKWPLSLMIKQQAYKNVLTTLQIAFGRD